ncbi:recombinase RecT [Corynebacterium accolens]|uniref:recombinase RecT n=1 Tax=Corynebacterium accolens TaxID=38284 RepID=UPI00266F5916|nr:recombinase RecT [Corynebacterium accolens]WKS54941.1 recombinase RecT [Corynebacterium accolens]
MARQLSDFTETEQAIIEQMGYAHIPIAHLEALFTTAQAMQLDPRLKRDIVLIERNGKKGKTYTIQVGIAGYRKSARKIADEKGITLSVSPWKFAGEDGQWRELWSFKRDGMPLAAQVTVYRDGEPFVQTAMWDEFVQEYNEKPMALWATKPSYMLGKTAESLAWRQAFPEEMGNTREESEVEAIARDEEQAMQVQRSSSSLQGAALGAQETAAIAQQAESVLTPEEQELLDDLMQETDIAELRQAHRDVAALTNGRVLQEKIEQRAVQLQKGK